MMIRPASIRTHGKGSFPLSCPFLISVAPGRRKKHLLPSPPDRRRDILEIDSRLIWAAALPFFPAPLFGR